MKKEHKHAEIIKAWADGAKIQVNAGEGWFDAGKPSWDVGCEYRIKPEPKPKPDFVRYVNVYDNLVHETLADAEMAASPSRKGMVAYIFDGETGDLKSAERMK